VALCLHLEISHCVRNDVFPGLIEKLQIFYKTIINSCYLDGFGDLVLNYQQTLCKNIDLYDIFHLIIVKFGLLAVHAVDIFNGNQSKFSRQFKTRSQVR